MGPSFPSHFKTTTSLQRQFEATTSTMKLLLVCIVFMTLKWEAEAGRMRRAILDCCDKVRVNRVAGASTIAWETQENLYDIYSITTLISGGHNVYETSDKGHAIWWSGGQWRIGPWADRGNNPRTGAKSVDKDDCVGDTTTNWQYFDGSDFVYADDGLVVNCV